MDEQSELFKAINRILDEAEELERLGLTHLITNDILAEKIMACNAACMTACEEAVSAELGSHHVHERTKLR